MGWFDDLFAGIQALFRGGRRATRDEEASGGEEETSTTTAIHAENAGPTEPASLHRDASRTKLPDPSAVVRLPRGPTANVSANPPSPQKRRRRTRRARRYHLGLDWGTSTTKMVLRDYDDPSADHGLAYVVRDGGDYRYPSTVAVTEGRLWLGNEAERRRGASLVVDSLKAHAALKGRWDDPVEGLEDCQYRDLATLAVAHHANRGYRLASSAAAAKGLKARMGMTVSVPVAELQVPRSARAYLAVATVAYQLGVVEDYDPQGAVLDEALARLRAAQQHAPDPGGVAYDAYLRAEVVAAMVWPFMSPRIGEGPYTVIDIGAATTNASWFRIHGAHDEDGVFRKKAGIAFFGAATKSPGMDAFDRVLARLVGEPAPALLRGQEERLVERLRDHADLEAVCDSFYETWAESRRRAHWRANSLKHWTGLHVLTIGGGAKVSLVRSKFSRLPGAYRGMIKGVRFVRDIGTPPDLREARAAAGRAFTGDPTFLLVAYGLSYNTLDLPEVSLPNEVPPFRQREFVREFKTSEELGYSDK